MTRPQTTTTDPGALAATGRQLEEALRKAIAAGFKPPTTARGPVCATAKASDRPGRVAAMAAMFGAPELAAELNSRHLTVREAVALLSSATGSAKWISEAGKEQVRVALVALDHTRATESANSRGSRVHQVGLLLTRHGLEQTRAGVAVASSTLPVEVLTQLVEARSNLFNRLDPAAQAGLLRDLTLTTTALKPEPNK